VPATSACPALSATTFLALGRNEALLLLHDRVAGHHGRLGLICRGYFAISLFLREESARVVSVSSTLSPKTCPSCRSSATASAIMLQVRVRRASEVRDRRVRGLHPVRLVRPVADDVDAELAFRVLDRRIAFSLSCRESLR